MLSSLATWSRMIKLSHSIFSLPFALAAVWWAWADLSGYTSRKAMDREDRRKQARIDKNRSAMGHGPRKRP